MQIAHTDRLLAFDFSAVPCWQRPDTRRDKSICGDWCGKSWTKPLSTVFIYANKIALASVSRWRLLLPTRYSSYGCICRWNSAAGVTDWSTARLHLLDLRSIWGPTQGACVKTVRGIFCIQCTFLIETNCWMPSRFKTGLIMNDVNE